MCDETGIRQTGEQANMPRTMQGAMMMREAAGMAAGNRLELTETRRIEMRIEDRELEMSQLRLQKQQLDLRIDELRMHNRRDTERLDALTSLSKGGGISG